jgi:hypothetical protein
MTKGKKVIEFYKKRLEKEKHKITKLDLKKSFIQVGVNAIKETIWTLEKDHEKDNL